MVSLHGERKWALKRGGGRVQAPKLISCRSQTQPQGRHNMCLCVCLSVCVCVCVCVRKRGSVRESSVNSEGHTMAEGEKDRQKRRGADLHQRDWICMRKSMKLLTSAAGSAAEKWAFVVH